jgi:predicted acyltransferase (DUF342 family)
MAWLEGGCYSTDMDQFFATTDAEITSAMREAARDASHPGYIHADRIINRRHFRVLHEGLLSDIIASGGVMKARQIAEAATSQVGADKIRYDSYPPKDSTIDFPIRERDGTVVSALSKSQVLKNIPSAAFDYVFSEKELLPKAKAWYNKNKDDLLALRSCK